jgi:Holliday junction resolvasome RuvABC endonuclease subunit
MNILAIDPATKLGWAISAKLCGMEDYTAKSGESSGYKLIKFKSFLLKILETEKIELVVYERAGGRFKNDIMSHAKWVAVIEMICIEKNIEYRAYSSGEIKKFATGNGACSKADMIKSAIRKYKVPVKDDNIADALHLLHLAKNDLS